MLFCRPGCLLFTLAIVVAVCLAVDVATAADDILLADFEQETYGDWKATGEAFGSGPARGTLPGQMAVSGYQGERLVNSFLKGDDSIGTLTSPEFTIQRKRINFLIGGGKWPGETCINLLIDGKAVRTATGPNDKPGGSERLRPHSWEVADLVGKKARLEIVDKRQGGWGHINIDQIVQSDSLPLAADDRQSLLEQAARSTAAAAERVKGDPRRPQYHLLPPANWLNDPNGPIYYRGAFHMFYQYNPYGDEWGHMHWGHFKSPDLVHWEHQPIALWPSLDKGEEHVFSGCATVSPKGELMLFYTSIGPRLPEQWAAVPEGDDLVKWKKHPANPLLTEKLHGEKKVYEWRDPFAFEAHGKRYLVCGGNLNGNKGGEGVVNVYQAQNDALTEWKYLGVLFQHPDRGVTNVECPLFFPLDGKWVCITSQGQPVHWFVGSLDEKTMKFTPETRGSLDLGSYYAPNACLDEANHRLLWGWVNGFPAGKGWRHCLSLPRQLSLSPKGELLQHPAPQLTALRREHPLSAAGVSLRGPLDLKNLKGDALEIALNLDLGTATAMTLRVRAADDAKSGPLLRWDGKWLEFDGVKTELSLSAEARQLQLRVFVDHSLVEIYANGRVCISRVIDAPPEHQAVFLTAEGGQSHLAQFDVWTLDSIWSTAKGK